MYVMGTSAQQKKKSATYHKVLVISQERTNLPFLKKPIQVSVLYQEATTVSGSFDTSPELYATSSQVTPPPRHFVRFL